MSIATQSDPEKLKKKLYENNYERSTTLDVVGLQNLKEKLSGSSRFSVK